MTIKIGDKLPLANFRMMSANGIVTKTTDEIFAGRTVALFSVPGAFTGTCDKMHLPNILASADALSAKGVDTIALTAVNDAWVMSAWKRAGDPGDRVLFLADGSADFAKAAGLDVDLNAVGMGVRGKRYGMLVVDGIVRQLNIETKPGVVEESGADKLLSQM